MSSARRLGKVLLTGGLAFAAATSVYAQDDPLFSNSGFGYSLHGFVRTWASVNLQNHPETQANDVGTLQMVRGSFELQGEAHWGEASLHAVGRADQEYETTYLHRLDNQQNGNLMNQYNRLDLREFYLAFPVGDRIDLKLGKQQVVWGETDFFRASDVISGFDYRWRSFLEADNEELRKPLELINVRLKVPEANGNLQAIIRPGLDRSIDIGNTYDLYGGRWANQPYKGVNFLAPGFGQSSPLLTYNLSSSGANRKDVTGGARWSGRMGDLQYSVAWLRTFNNDPVVNPNPAITGGVAYGQAPRGFLGDLIYPEVNLVAFTANDYSPLLDAVWSTEVVYYSGQPFNLRGSFPGVPGLGGIAFKDTLVTMGRFDKQVDLTRLLGTSRPSFASIQIFNTHIMNYRDLPNSSPEQLVKLVGFGAPLRKDTTIITGILATNYMNDRINPGIAVGWDATYGGGFAIPNVDIAVGNNWRVRAELDLFFPTGQASAVGQPNPRTGLFGYFANDNQIMFRVTRQF